MRVAGVGTHDVYNPATDTVDGPASPPWQANPPNGYSDYASIGQYWISGTRIAPLTDMFAITPVDASRPEGDSGVTTFTFNVSRSGSPDQAASVDFSVLPSLSNAVGTFYPYKRLLTYTVTRSGDSNSPATVDWFVDVSGHADPASGADFVGGILPTGQVLFGVGVTAVDVEVLVDPDAVLETDEFFELHLQNPAGVGSVGIDTAFASARGIILDDDSLVSLVVGNNYDLTEGNTGVTSYTFDLVRTDRFGDVIDVSWAVIGTGQHPADGLDFVGGQLPSGVIQFDALQTTATVTIDVMTDLDFERFETFDFSLLRSSGGAVGTASISAAIINDDRFPTEPAEVRLSLVDLDSRPGIQVGEDFDIDECCRSSGS